MIWLSAFIILSLCFAIFFYGHCIRNLNQARRSGLYPDKGKATMFDVRRLILKKEKYLAVRLYGEIFRTNYWEAQKAVEELERSIQEKNIQQP